MEARRLAILHMEQQRLADQENAEMISSKMIEDAQEIAKVEGQRILKAAKLAAEYKENTIRALIENDDRIVVRVFKENIQLKEDLRLLDTSLENAKKEIEHWREKFYSAYNWLSDAVRRLEFLGDFGLSKIFKNNSGKIAAKRLDR